MGFDRLLNFTDSVAGSFKRAFMSQRVQFTYMVECRVSILEIAIMISGSMPHNSA